MLKNGKSIKTVLFAFVFYSGARPLRKRRGSFRKA
jgi:hypothetical protein